MLKGEFIIPTIGSLRNEEMCRRRRNLQKNMAKFRNEHIKCKKFIDRKKTYTICSCSYKKYYFIFPVLLYGKISIFVRSRKY